MKKLFLSVLAGAMLCFTYSGVQAQACSMDVVYNAGVATEADFQSANTTLTSCIQDYLLNSNGLATTVSFVGVTGGNSPVVTLNYTLNSVAADSTTIVTATTGGPFPFGFGVINCLTAGLPAIDGFGFTSSIVSATTIGCNGPPTAVPTLSQWGLILFGLVVLCIGGIALWHQAQRKDIMQDA